MILTQLVAVRWTRTFISPLVRYASNALDPSTTPLFRAPFAGLSEPQRRRIDDMTGLRAEGSRPTSC